LSFPAKKKRKEGRIGGRDPVRQLPQKKKETLLNRGTGGGKEIKGRLPGGVPLVCGGRGKAKRKKKKKPS